MKVLLSGGGTGGHIYPAICIGRALEKKVPGTELLFVGTKKGMEAELVPKEGIPMKTITIRGIKRSLSLENLKAIVEVFQGIWGARKIIKEFQPDVVVGTGGYVCGPVLLVAALMGIPTMIHEQNAAPGVTNRILSRFVDRIAVTYEGTEKFFHRKEKVFCSGNPIRENFKLINKEDGKQLLGFDKDRPLILVTGGSLGSKAINFAMKDVIRQCLMTSEFQILHVTGSVTFQDVKDLYKGIGVESTFEGPMQVMPYLNQMAEALSAADLVICRAGAGVMAEVAVAGCPAIIVPYPYATNNHQEMNGRAYEKAGGGIVYLEKDLTSEGLLQLVGELMGNAEKRREMSEKGQAYGKPESGDIIANEIIQMLDKG